MGNEARRTNKETAIASEITNVGETILEPKRKKSPQTTADKSEIARGRNKSKDIDEGRKTKKKKKKYSDSIYIYI